MSNHGVKELKAGRRRRQSAHEGQHRATRHTHLRPEALPGANVQFFHQKETRGRIFAATRFWPFERVRRA